MAFAMAATACAKAQARTQPEMPPLDPPPPPPRFIAPVDRPSAPTTPSDEGPARAPQRATPRARSDRSEPPAPKPEATKPETASTEPPPEAAPPPADEASPRTLRTAPPAGDQQAERNIRAQLARATRDLSRVDYGALSNDAKAQYDTAKRFIQQADDALKARNYVFAATLADKAGDLAAVLLGR